MSKLLQKMKWLAARFTCNVKIQPTKAVCRHRTGTIPYLKRWLIQPFVHSPLKLSCSWSHLAHRNENNQLHSINNNRPHFDVLTPFPLIVKLLTLPTLALRRIFTRRLHDAGNGRDWASHSSNYAYESTIHYAMEVIFQLKGFYIWKLNAR